MKIINPGELDSLSIINNNFNEVSLIPLIKYFKFVYNNKILPRVFKIDLDHNYVFLNDKPDEVIIITINYYESDREMIVIGPHRINWGTKYIKNDGMTKLNVINNEIIGSEPWQLF